MEEHVIEARHSIDVLNFSINLRNKSYLTHYIDCFTHSDSTFINNLRWVLMMDSFISLNEGEKDVQHPISTKDSSFVSNASDLCFPLFQPGEDISNNQSVSEIVEEIWKDHRDHMNDVLEEMLIV